MNFLEFLHKLHSEDIDHTVLVYIEGTTHEVDLINNTISNSYEDISSDRISYEDFLSRILPNEYTIFEGGTKIHLFHDSNSASIKITKGEDRGCFKISANMQTEEEDLKAIILESIKQKSITPDLSETIFDHLGPILN